MSYQPHPQQFFYQCGSCPADHLADDHPAERCFHQRPTSPSMYTSTTYKESYFSISPETALTCRQTAIRPTGNLRLYGLHKTLPPAITYNKMMADPCPPNISPPWEPIVQNTAPWFDMLSSPPAAGDGRHQHCPPNSIVFGGRVYSLCQ